MSTKSLVFEKFSMPRILLHLEGAAILTASLVLYAYLHFSWGTLALFLLAPDLPLFIYLINKRAGSFTYNIVHTIILPLILAVFSVQAENTLGIKLH